MRRLVQAFTIAAAAALAACSGGDDGPFAPPPPGCDHQPTNAICVTSPTLTEPACGWTWRPEGCPGTNLVGTCAEPSGQVTYFYSPGYNVFSADAACFGAFTPIASGPIVSVSHPGAVHSVTIGMSRPYPFRSPNRTGA